MNDFEDHNPPGFDPLAAPDPSVPPESAHPSPPGADGQEYPPASETLSDDLRVPWGWLDLLLLAIIYFAGGIALSRFLIKEFGLFGVTRAQLQKSVSEQSFFFILAEALLDFGLLAYLAAQMRIRFGSPFWRTIGWKRLDTGTTPRGVAYLGLIAGGFLFSIVIQVASAAFGTKANLPIENFFQDRRSALLLMLMAVLLAPVIEETVFRGYLYPVLARTFGVTGGVLITGTLFGLLHSFQLWGGWMQIALLVVVGIVFTYARARSKTVVASYLLHVSYNSFIFLAFLFASDGFRKLPVHPLH
jgi:uncharacterized protein